MKWSWRIARLAGIDVYVHSTFLILLAWVALSHYLESRSVAAMMAGLLFVLTLFGVIVLHELGHALTARRFGIRTRDITLLPIGGVARLERMPDDPRQELLVALAGPAVNVVIGAALFALLQLTSGLEPLGALSITHGSFVERVMLVNVFLAAFNLLPAFPMDGGRALRAILAIRMEYARATYYAAVIGQALALVFGLIGFFTNPMLMFIALFVWIGASQESSAAQVKSALAGIPVTRAMITNFQTVRPSDTLTDVTNLILAGGDTPMAEMLAGIDEGLLVDDILGLGQGNIISGAFSNPLSLAFKIEKGEIVGRVKDVSIAGNVYDLLKDVTAVSRETLWVYGGLCMPYVLLPEMNVIAKE